MVNNNTPLDTGFFFHFCQVKYSELTLYLKLLYKGFGY